MTETDSTYDVAVVGGGVMGAATAHALVQQGASVLVLDRYRAAHTHGSSHGDGRIVRATYAEPVYVALARRAAAGWRALETASGTTLLDGGGVLEIARAGSKHLAALAATLTAQGLPFEHLDARGVTSRFPQIALAAPSEALYQGDGGTVRAALAQQALWRAAVSGGVSVVRDAEVVGLDARRDGVRIRTGDRRTWRARRLILTVGAWTNALLALLDARVPLRVTQEQVAYLPVPPGAVDHGVGALPALLDRHHQPSFYALPQIEVAGVKVGRHRAGPVVEPDAPRPDDPVRLREVVAWARATLPELPAAPFAVAPCLYTNTPDFDFVIDRVETAPSVIVGAGFSGHGFKFAPVIGEMLAALALDLPDPVPRTKFRADRFR